MNQSEILTFLSWLAELNFFYLIKMLAFSAQQQLVSRTQQQLVSRTQQQLVRRTQQQLVRRTQLFFIIKKIDSIYKNKIFWLHIYLWGLDTKQGRTGTACSGSISTHLIGELSGGQGSHLLRYVCEKIAGSELKLLSTNDSSLHVPITCKAQVTGFTVHLHFTLNICYEGRGRSI